MQRVLFFIFIFSMLSINSHALEIGDDGLHKEPWFSVTFKDIREDIDTAAADNKHLVLIFEQRGCIYCKEMHEKVFIDPEVVQYIENHFMFVQFNMDGSEEVTDTDGQTLEEREAFEKWGLFATPTMIILPKEIEASNTANAVEAAIQVVPGAFGRWTTLNLLKWIHEGAYKDEPNFQKYHGEVIKAARKKGLL